MSDFPHLALAFAAGMSLGAVFFGGLWWTVNRGLASERPALWFFVSMLARTGAALGGFYVIGGDNWERWLLCIVGFVLARTIVEWLTHPPTGVKLEPESGYAP